MRTPAGPERKQGNGEARITLAISTTQEGGGAKGGGWFAFSWGILVGLKCDVAGFLRCVNR